VQIRCRHVEDSRGMLSRLVAAMLVGVTRLTNQFLREEALPEIEVSYADPAPPTSEEV